MKLDEFHKNSTNFTKIDVFYAASPVFCMTRSIALCKKQNNNSVYTSFRKSEKKIYRVVFLNNQRNFLIYFPK
jgi:hypothetical protein